MNIDILGSRWHVSVLEADTFTKRYGAAAGVTIGTFRKIVINEEDLTFGTVAHEIWHAALDSVCVSTASLKPPQLEEVTCELFALHGVALARLAYKLTKALRKER